MFSPLKTSFFSGNKTLNKRSGANSKTHFLLKFATNFLLFLSFFSFFAQKMLKKHILTSVWSGQHQNAGWNIQQRFHHTKWLLHYKLLHNKRVNNFLGRLLVGRSPVFCVPWFYVWSSSSDIPLHFPSCPFHLFLVSDLKKYRHRVNVLLFLAATIFYLWNTGLETPLSPPTAPIHPPS